MLFRHITLLLSFLFLTTACNNESINKRDMIVIAHHYPEYLSCGFLLEVAVNRVPALDDTLAIQRDGEVSCEDFARDENSSTLEKSCYVRDMNADTNDTCVIGSNISDYVGDATALVDSIIGTAKDKNATQ